MTQQHTLTTRIWAELFLLALIWGGVFLAARLALDEVPFVTSVAHRVFWATLILWGYVCARGLAVPRSPRVWGALLVMGCLNNVIPFSLMAWGQLHIPSGLRPCSIRPLNFVPVSGHWGTLSLSMKGAPNGTPSTEVYGRV